MTSPGEDGATVAGDERSAAHGPDPTRPFRTTFRGIASVVGPASLVTGLLYYFGWARTSVQAQTMGLDESLLGFSTEDYLLNSMSSMFVPLLVGVSAVLVALALHMALIEWLGEAGVGTEPDGRRRTVVRGLVASLAAAAVVLTVVGGIGARVQAPTRFVSLASPIAITVGIAFGGYAVHLAGRFLRRPRPVRTGEQASLHLLGSSLFVVLLLLGTFWSVSHYAGVKGVDLALLVERHLSSRPDVALYSARRLHVQPPVVEEELGPADESGYRFSYRGLKLLFRSGGNLFLRPSDPSASRVNVIVPEADDLRLDVARSGQLP